MPSSDLLILGTGAAGCACALAAADAGLTVSMLSRDPAPESGSNTSWAQGGIIYRGDGDSAELLVNDVLAAGAGICRLDAVELLARRGPRLVEELLIQRCGVPFDRAEGGLHRTGEAAHSVHRIVHVGDHTGSSIAERMMAVVRANPAITVRAGMTAVDLVMRGYHTTNPTDIYHRPRCLGAYALDQGAGQVEHFVARETVLATGGLGQIYLHTTNPPGARGDGLAMAYRAGARVICLEYVQFHPTAFYHRTAPRFLLSESMRGEGGRLIGADGKPFMQGYHPLGDLAPRDVVAGAIHEEMLRTGQPSVFLDMTHKDGDWLRTRFPSIHAFCLSNGVDIARQPIPVTPAAHYSCGGVAVDAHGRTNISGLRAVGEVSCTGVHGANRLASTSLLEALVWGVQAAEGVARDAEENPPPSLDDIAPWQLEREPVDPALLQQDWLAIKHTMWNYVGLVRTSRRMNRALQILRELQFEVENFYRRAEPTDELLGLRNGVQTALALTHAALRNRASRGAHHRVS